METISAIVLAAGLSIRMGRPKMLLPWNHSTIIQTVVQSLVECKLEQIIVITGAYHKEIEILLKSTPAKIVFNPNFENGEMLNSFQTGLRAIEGARAALLMLGDQPQIQKETINNVITSYTDQYILMPSFQMRRGHPWIIHQSAWSEILALKPPETLRDFMQKHNDQIGYVNIDTATILQDLDTPEDYQKIRSTSKADGDN